MYVVVVVVAVVVAAVLLLLFWFSVVKNFLHKWFICCVKIGQKGRSKKSLT